MLCGSMPWSCELLQLHAQLHSIRSTDHVVDVRSGRVLVELAFFFFFLAPMI